MLRGMENQLPGRSEFALERNRRAGVRVAVELGEIAARNLQADAVARTKLIAGCQKIDVKLVNPVGLQQLRSLPGVPVSRADHAVAENARVPGGLQINELGREVGIGR